MPEGTAKQYLLGLTGSIGMGKSTTAAMFAQAGIPVWDADAVVHRLYEPGGRAVGPVSALCPDALRDGAIDRAVLKGWIAEDPDALARLESAVHPLVAADRCDFMNAQSSDILAFDIPLLFETGADTWLDGVAVASTTPENQRTRVLQRPGVTPEVFEHLLNKQLSDTEKRRRADFVICTDTLEEARQGVKDTIRKIREVLDA